MKTQTNSREYEGQCKFCEQDFAEKQIVDHLDNCEKRKKNQNIKNLRLKISDPNMKNFWLIVESNNQATFKNLDVLIKDVWVECCGHLSQFGGLKKEVGKGKIIMDTLDTGGSIDYTYDFGSSTELVIKALKYSNYQLSGKGKVELVARNYLPPSNCVKCGQQATLVCAACIDNGSTFVCDKCAEKYHNEESEKEEHYLLPLANSPRCGVCGYEPAGPLDKLF